MSTLTKKIKIACYGIHGCFMALVSLVSVKRALQPGTDGRLVTVSVTSFGKRAGRTLPVVLRSLLLQKRRPDRIVAWLDSTKFSDSTLPPVLSRMRRKYGVEIRYCHDVRSYTKLVPSLIAFPDDIVITADDDQYYNRHLVSKLLQIHERYPDDIVCTLGHVPTFGADGQLQPYNSWKQNVCQGEETPLFPLGVGGVLYPAGSLHEDTVNDSLFLKLSPYADDIWFWVMELLAGTRARLAESEKRLFYPIDLFDQLLHKGHSLMDVNMRENRNDVQIHDVFAHYGIQTDENCILKMLDIEKKC